jgi:hypothetical protein
MPQYLTFILNFASHFSMPATKRSRRAHNLNHYAVKVSNNDHKRPILPRNNQKQKFDQATPSASVTVEPDDGSQCLERALSTSSERSTILSDLSEDNDVPAHENLNGLLTWLADGKKRLRAKLGGLASQVQPTVKKLRGPYRLKGTEQSKRTKQHHAKQERDAFAKARADGYGDLKQMLSRKEPRPLPTESEPHLNLDEESIGDFDSDGEGMMGPDEWDMPNWEKSTGSSWEKASDKTNMDTAHSRICNVTNGDELDDLPDVLPPPTVTNKPWEPYIPSRSFLSPPQPDAIEKCLSTLKNITHPKRQTGYGHKDPHLNLVLRARLETMITFLRIYKMNGFLDWTASSQVAAAAAGKGSWLARKLREWVHCLIRDETDLPTHSYGKFNSSILEDEDLAEEIHLHLQGIGPWIKAADIVQYLNTPEMKARLNLKKPISERTARRWMYRISYRWKREPKGQYKDGHEREDVVEFRQNVFLPAMSKLLGRMTKWRADGSAEPDDIGQHRVIFWNHDESTFFANDRRKLRWVHGSEGAKPQAKGEGASLMVADFVSAEFGWLRSPDGCVKVIFDSG